VSDLANRIQQPPPEAAIPEAPIVNEMANVAWRVAVAYHRGTVARRVQVDGMEQAWCRPRAANELHRDIARYLILKGVKNIERFVTAQFRYSVPKGNTLSLAPQLTSFKHENAWKRWECYDRFAEHDLEHNLEAAQREFQCCLIEAEQAFPSYSDRQLWKVVLMNKMLEIPALFRYCVAVSEGVDEAIRAFRASAFEMFLTDPTGYCNAWGKVIPPALKQEAETFLMCRL